MYQALVDCYAEMGDKSGLSQSDHRPTPHLRRKPPMKMYMKSVVVDDQAKALAFYTDILGFTVKEDIPLGEYRWITVVSPEEKDGIELALEPNAHAASRVFQDALMKDGIPFTAFSVDDIDAEYQRLCDAGVSFTQPPTKAGPVTLAVFNDTCGNLIQLIKID
ncbi:MAG: VOC family protein [Maricaulis sp.]|jgi:catechol 2,3-dioxygenase-like lactoylglutathione lyase family enzyme|nr:VOC family protein [Maricaulis sp.]